MPLPFTFKYKITNPAAWHTLWLTAYRPFQTGYIKSFPWKDTPSMETVIEIFAVWKAPSLLSQLINNFQGLETLYAPWLDSENTGLQTLLIPWLHCVAVSFPNHSSDSSKCVSEAAEAASSPSLSPHIRVFLLPLYRKWCSRFLSLFLQRWRSLLPHEVLLRIKVTSVRTQRAWVTGGVCSLIPHGGCWTQSVKTPKYWNDGEFENFLVGKRDTLRI